MDEDTFENVKEKSQVLEKLYEKYGKSQASQDGGLLSNYEQHEKDDFERKHRYYSSLAEQPVLAMAQWVKEKTSFYANIELQDKVEVLKIEQKTMMMQSRDSHDSLASYQEKIEFLQSENSDLHDQLEKLEERFET